MSIAPGAAPANGLQFHELPTCDLEVHHDGRSPGQDHPPTAPNEVRSARLREEWWRAWLVGSAAALMTAGVTTGLLLGLGRGPGEQLAADMSRIQLAAARSIVSPAPELAGPLVLDRSGDVAVADSPTAMLSNAEQSFAAPAPGVAAVYRQPGTVDPDTGAPKHLAFIGLDARLADPAGQLDAYLRSVASGHAGASFRPAAAGPGATGECATFTDGGGQRSECGWATQHTVGVLDAPGRDYDAGQLASLMRAARPHLESGRA